MCVLLWLAESVSELRLLSVQVSVMNESMGRRDTLWKLVNELRLTVSGRTHSFDFYMYMTRTWVFNWARLRA